jgi:hypothetical protein
MDLWNNSVGVGLGAGNGELTVQQCVDKCNKAADEAKLHWDNPKTY